jgi:hypothetical protein
MVMSKPTRWTVGFALRPLHYDLAFEDLVQGRKQGLYGEDAEEKS